MKWVAWRGPQTLPRGVDTLGMWKPRKNPANSAVAVVEGCVPCFPAAGQCGTHTPVVLGSRPHLALLLRLTLGDKERGKEIVLVWFVIFFLSM